MSGVWGALSRHALGFAALNPGYEGVRWEYRPAHHPNRR